MNVPRFHFDSKSLNIRSKRALDLLSHRKFYALWTENIEQCRYMKQYSSLMENNIEKYKLEKREELRDSDESEKKKILDEKRCEKVQTTTSTDIVHWHIQWWNENNEGNNQCRIDFDTFYHQRGRSTHPLFISIFFSSSRFAVPSLDEWWWRSQSFITAP